MLSSDHLQEKNWLRLIAGVSVLVVAAVALLLLRAQNVQEFTTEIYLLPKINAFINSGTFLLLLLGFYFIKKKQIQAHQYTMIGAFCLSVLFLVSYLTYHFNAPATHFGGTGWVKGVYLFILLSHILLAIFIVPLALLTVFRVWNLQVAKHRKIARWTLPIWLYVSLTGVVVYLMISPYYPA